MAGEKSLCRSKFCSFSICSSYAAAEPSRTLWTISFPTTLDMPAIILVSCWSSLPALKSNFLTIDAASLFRGSSLFDLVVEYNPHQEGVNDICFETVGYV